MARIDRLEETAKQTLQLASVIGREFTRRLLDRIAQARGRTEQLLRDLKAIELIYEKSLFPELAYMFKHALTHEVMDEVLRRHRHLLGLQVRNDRRAHSSSAARLKPDRTRERCSRGLRRAPLPGAYAYRHRLHEVCVSDRQSFRFL